MSNENYPMKKEFAGGNLSVEVKKPKANETKKIFIKQEFPDIDFGAYKIRKNSVSKKKKKLEKMNPLV